MLSANVCPTDLLNGTCWPQTHGLQPGPSWRSLRPTTGRKSTTSTDKSCWIDMGSIFVRCLDDEDDSVHIPCLPSWSWGWKQCKLILLLLRWRNAWHALKSYQESALANINGVAWAVREDVRSASTTITWSNRRESRACAHTIMSYKDQILLGLRKLITEFIAAHYGRISYLDSLRMDRIVTLPAVC